MGIDFPYVEVYRSVMEQIVENDLTSEETFDLLDTLLTDLLQKAGADVGDEECMSLLISYNRQLMIALGLPVEVAS